MPTGAQRCPLELPWLLLAPPGSSWAPPGSQGLSAIPGESKGPLAAPRSSWQSLGAPRCLGSPRGSFSHLLKCRSHERVRGSPGKSRKESQEDPGTLQASDKSFRGCPPNSFTYPLSSGLPSDSSLAPLEFRHVIYFQGDEDRGSYLEEP